ncbi:MAG: hypothetical protein ACXWCT_15025, partial [Flavitalea sp.]
YPLFDITVSPLTAGVSKVKGDEEKNPAREPGTLVEAQNFGNISVSGTPKQRKLRIEFIGLTGEKLAAWEVMESVLKHPQP